MDPLPNKKKRKFNGFTDQSISDLKSIEDLGGIKKSITLDELEKTSAKVRKTIVVSYDTDLSNDDFDSEQAQKLNEELKKWHPRVLPSQDQIRDLFFKLIPLPKKSDYMINEECIDNGPFSKSYSIQYEKDLIETKEKNQFRFFFVDAAFSIDPKARSLAIEIYGLTDTRHADKVNEEEKRKKSYNVPCMMRVLGFEPYFFIEYRNEWTIETINSFIQELDFQLVENCSFTKKELEEFEYTWGYNRWVTGYEFIEYQDFMGYQGTEMKTAIKIKVRHPKMIKACRDLIENPKGKISHRKWRNNFGDEMNYGQERMDDFNQDESLREMFSPFVDLQHIPYNWIPPPDLISRLDDYDVQKLCRNFKYQFIPPTKTLQKMIESTNKKKIRIYEADIDFIQRFIADNNIIPCSWYYVEKDKVDFVEHWQEKTSKCLVEGIIDNYKNLIRIEDEVIQNDLPNFVRFSFDDEMQTKEGRFCDADLDAIIKKGVTINVDKNREELHSFVFSLGKIAYSKPHAFSCYEYDNEVDTIRGWINFFNIIDPDIILHYNGNNFDWKYNLQRCKVLCIVDIQFLTRHKSKTVYRPPPRTSRGKIKSTCRILGRINIDMYLIIQETQKFDDNTLGAVSSNILGRTKEEFDIHLLSQLQKSKTGNEKSSVYVEKDARLPLELYDKLNIGGIQTAQIARILLQNCFDRAQGAKVEGKLTQECISDNGVRLLKETLPKNFDNLQQTVKSNGKKASHYVGGTVIKPQPGYYQEYILVLDFTSMYPSIMQAWNICYTTYITEDNIRKLGFKEGEDYLRVPDWITPDNAAPIAKYNPDNPCFVTRKIKEGILPRIERELGEARSTIKKELWKELQKNPNGSFLATLLDGEQNAIKGWMNSVYGLSGDPTSKYYFKHIASTITGFGRWMLHSIKIETQIYYNRLNYRSDNQKIPKIPYPFDANVVYGKFSISI